MAKSDDRRVDITRKDVYEIKVGDREPLQLTRKEAENLLNNLDAALGQGETETEQPAPEEYVAPVPVVPKEAPPTRPSAVKSVKQRRKQTLAMSGVVIIVIAAAFVAFNLVNAPSGSAFHAPARPYEHFEVTGEGDITFNGTSPGPTMTVANNTNVWVSFTVSSSSSIAHSWVLVLGNSTPVTAPTYPPAFPNAATPNPTSGSAPGVTVQVVFKVTKPGTYKYICEVPGHFEGGMFGYFNVTAGNGTTNATAVASLSGMLPLQSSLSTQVQFPLAFSTVAQAAAVLPVKHANLVSSLL